MTGCRCCVFLTIFTLSVVFGKSFPKHVSLVKARFGDTLGYGAGTARGCKGVVSDSQFFLTSRALCPDFDVQIFSQRRELPFCHFLLAACRWIQFVLLGTLWLGTCADWCQLGL
ncbi:unnamed protein product [Effrenium voratum]|nr:unnamed protein product [Effrenium voratum]CAJ1454190.1 unnamed protein product [Effrenium voratum]